MIVLVRYGEIGLKGRNRPLFEKRLAEQVRRALEPLGATVHREHGRLFVETNAQWTEVADRLRRVFGIVSFSPVRIAPLQPEAIAEAARAELLEAASSLPRGAQPVTFKVATRRANKRFPFTSLELNRQLGATLLASGSDVPLAVDVHRPQITIHVEIRDDAAYVYARSEDGPGGLPVGVGGHALALLSGGIDSPVAVWLTMKRGVRVDCVHFHSYPFTSDRSKEKVVDLTRALARYGGPIRLHVVHFTDIQTAIYRHCPAELGVTIMRRMMFRIAERLAARVGALALVTGENLGQVASQTLESLRTIAAVTAMPVLRPLIGFDKQEIVDLAQRIGTFPISVRPYEDCCSLFVPKNPRTKPSIAEAERAEAALEVPGLIQDALARTETLELDEVYAR